MKQLPRTAEEFQKSRQATIAKLLRGLALTDKHRKTLARQIDMAILSATYGIGVTVAEFPPKTA